MDFLTDFVTVTVCSSNVFKLSCELECLTKNNEPWSSDFSEE